MTPGRRGAAFAAGVAGLTLLLYAPTLTHYFINWDDGSVVDRAAGLVPLSWTTLRWMLTSYELSTWQPLPWLVYALLYSLGGASPAVYHGFSWLVHSAAAGAFFYLARALLAPSLEKPLGSGRLDALAAACALLFAWHPLQVETVAAAASISDMLAVALSVAAVALYASGAAAGRALSLAFFVLAALCRWQAFVVPVAIAACDLVQGRRLSLKRLWPFLAVAAMLVVIYAAVKGEQHQYTRVAQRPEVIAVGLLFYARLWLWPSGLLPVYLMDELAAGAGSSVILGAVGIALIVFGLWRRAPGITAAAAVYAAAVAPPLFLTGGGPVYGHDRYAYLACAGFPILLGWLAGRAWLGPSRLSRALAAGAAVVVVAAAGGAAAAQLDVWRDPRVFWEHALDVRPEWPLALDRLGEALLGAGRTREAIAVFKRAERFAPEASRLNQAVGHFNLGVELAQSGALVEAEASFRTALELNPGLDLAREYLGRVRRARASGKRRSGSARTPASKAS